MPKLPARAPVSPRPVSSRPVTEHAAQSTAMSVLFTAIFSAASIVWDREFGFLREILVAPVGRASIVIGKAWAGPPSRPSRALSS